MSAARQIRRWKNLPGHADGPLSVAALLDFCAQEGLDPAATVVTGGHLQWSTDETDDERHKRETAEAASTERTNEWERKNLARLLAKHGYPKPTP